MIEGRTILLTGGAGFIGTHLVERLHTKNRCIVFDNMRRDALGPTGLLEMDGVELIRGDVRDKEAMIAACAEADVVIHLAAIAGVDTVIANPVLVMEIALLGTYNALEGARASGRCTRFVDFSTSEVFGRFAYKVSEGDTTALGAVGEARWTYAVSKLATEHLAHNYAKQFALPTASVRPFNIYGPRQVGEGAIHHFIRRAIAGEDLEVHNDGSQVRSWCYIDDIIEGVLLILERDEAPGHAFNLGNPRSTLTIHHLAREVVRLAGASEQSTIRYVPRDLVDVELRIPNVDKARDLLGWEPRVDLEEGILRTIQWYRDNPR
jgi:nucleoside-diphosphate-sugar epimerase